MGRINIKKAKNYSITRRIVFSLVVTVVLVSTITIALLYFTMVSDERNQFINKTEDLQNNLVRLLERPLWDYDLNAIRGICETFSQNDLVVKLTIADESNSNIYNMEKEHSADTINRSGKIQYLGEHLGTFEIELTKQYIDNVVHKFWISLATTIFLIVSALLVVASVLVRSLLKYPIGELDNIVRNYAAGNYESNFAELPYIEFQSFGEVLLQMGERIQEQVKELKDNEELISKLNKTFLKLGPNYENNVQILTAACGELLGATCALYNKLDKGLLYAQGTWHTPEEYNPIDQPDGHLCFDVIQRGKGSGPYIVRDLPDTSYFKTDPNVSRYNLMTYVGHPVNCYGETVGSLCAVYKEDTHLSERDQRVLEIIAMAMEIEEERRQAQERIHKLNEELEQRVVNRTNELAIAKEAAETANTAKSDFLARMSHEIRTPLNAVTGLTTIVLKSELTDAQRDYLNKALIAGGNLLAVINDILDFSKVEAGRMQLEQQPFDLDQLLEQLCDLFSNRVAKKDLELIFAIAPDVPRQLTGDAGRLTQVLTNLIENAIKFTDLGEIVVGVELSDKVEDTPEQTTLKLLVKDTGSGITPDVLPTLFEPFTQADSYLTRKHEGTGLGLAICRRLVELMGGRIWAESTPDQGSTFHFTIIVGTQEKEKPRFAILPNLHGLKALVVDDNAIARQVLVDLLGSFTFDVVAVDSGEKAIETIHLADQDKPYQLVLLDWRMPGMDGIETARAIRSDLKITCPPIIILITAYGRQLLQKHIDEASIDTMLLKPVKPSDLFNTIAQLLGETSTSHPAQKTDELLFQQCSGRRVLVVEDSELNREVAVALLEEAGLMVETAENGQIAVDMVSGSPKGYYHAVLMDIQMPVMDGYEATRKIRLFEKQQGPTTEQQKIQTPIIALTAHALKGEKEKCLAADMDDYLAKPLDEQELHQMLNKWISSQQEQPDTSDRS